MGERRAEERKGELVNEHLFPLSDVMSDFCGIHVFEIIYRDVIEINF